MNIFEHGSPKLEEVLLSKVRDAKLNADAVVPVIGVDGSAAVGKGTLMKKLREVGYMTFSNGEFFRAVSWCYLHGNYSESTLPQFFKDIEATTFSLQVENGKTFIIVQSQTFGEVLLDPDSDDPDLGLRSSHITSVISQLSEIPEVIAQVTKYLKEAVNDAQARRVPFAFDGRDNYATFDRENVNPATDSWLDAMILLYLAADDAALEQRAIARSNAHRKKRGLPAISPQEQQTVVKKLHARNQYERSRTHGKLLTTAEAKILEEKGVYDAVIDTTHLTEEEVFLAVGKLVLLKLANFSQN